MRSRAEGVGAGPADRLWPPRFSVDSSERVFCLMPREAFHEKDRTFYPVKTLENLPPGRPWGFRVGLCLRRPRPSPATYRWGERERTVPCRLRPHSRCPRPPGARPGAPLDFSPIRSPEPCTQPGCCGWTFPERGPAVPSTSCGQWSEPTQPGLASASSSPKWARSPFPSRAVQDQQG